VRERKTTMKISLETREKLLALKIAWNLKTLEEVVERLIEICGEQCKKAINVYLEYMDKVKEIAGIASYSDSIT
jgi:hypothetical protein